MRILIRLSIFFVATLGWSVNIYAQNSSRINPQIKPPKAGDGVAQESSLNLMRLNLHRAFVSNNRVREIPAKQPVIATVQRQTRMARTNPNLGRPIVPWCGNDPYWRQRRYRLETLCQSWTHSREEQQKGTTGLIFRPTGSKIFPRSWFRMKYVFHQNGALDYLYSAPNDGHHMKRGSWSLDRDNVVIRIGGRPFRILELKKNLLRIAAMGR